MIAKRSEPAGLLIHLNGMKTLIPAIVLALLASCASVCPVEPLRTQVFPLKHSDATSVAQTVGREERGKPGMIEMAADTRTNSIIVKADDEGLARVGRRIRELDDY